MSDKPENSNQHARRVRWMMVSATAIVALSCGGSTDTGPNNDGVAAVVVTPPSSTIALGAQLPLQAQVQDATGKVLPDAPIVWSVKDSAIASVSAAGVVTARSVGATQVAASSNGKSGIAAITVQKTPVASVVVRPTHVDATAGSTAQFTGIAYDAAQNTLEGRAIIWTTSNAGVATVDANGLMTAVAAGSATITGTSEGKSDAATVSVVQGPVSSVVLTPDTVSMFTGQTTPLVATTRDATGAVVTGTPVAWSTSNSSVATVSSEGVVTAVSVGTATITATSNGHNGTATVIVSSVPVASVTVSPSSVSVVQGGTTSLTATMKDASGNVLANRAVSWSSSNTQVATVSGTGVVTGVGAGTTTINAVSENKGGSATVTVTPPVTPVGSVVVSPATASVVAGQTTTLVATVKDANGTVVTNRVVTWTSSNAAVATVSTAGVVTGVTTGTATISATSEGKSGSAIVTVTPAPVGSVAVAPSASTIIIGQTGTLTATVSDVNGTVVTDRVVTWASSNTSIAKVSTTGVVSGIALGSATITATSEAKSGTATVTIAPIPVGSVTVSPATASVVAGLTKQLSATVKDVNGTVVTDRPITWSSSNAAAATVSQSGLVTAVATGSATITASAGGQSGSAAITVTPAPVASVTVSPSTSTVSTGQTTTLTATVKDVNGTVVTDRTVTWSSNNSAIATVSSSGVVTGGSQGSATITATAEGKSGSASVTVVGAPVASVTVSPSTVSVNTGATTTLTATLKDANGVVLTGRVVTWSSSAPLVASVSSSGVVAGLVPGEATITATSEGKSGTSAVTVTLIPVGSVTVSPSTASVASGSTKSFTATVKDLAGNVLSGRLVTWSSSNTNVATVSTSGVATGLAAGTATITATCEGKSDSGTLTVTPGPIATVSVAPPSATITKESSIQLTATAKDANGNVVAGALFTWQSSEGSIATVSSGGLVVGKKAGTTLISATSNGKTGSSTITVTP